MLCQYKFTQNNFIIKTFSILDLKKKNHFFKERFKKSSSEQWVFIICQQLHFLNYATTTQISSKPCFCTFLSSSPSQCSHACIEEKSHLLGFLKNYMKKKWGEKKRSKFKPYKTIPTLPFTTRSLCQRNLHIIDHVKS